MTSSGEVIISRAETNKIEFISPETLSGICVESDETGKENSYTLSFDNVSTDVPKSLMGKMSLIFLAISDEHAMKIKRLNKNDFYKVTDESLINDFKGTVPYSVKTNIGEVLIITTYDSKTGEVLMQSASVSDSSATLIYKSNTQNIN